MINFSQDTWVYKLEVGTAGLRCPGWNVYLCPRCLLPCKSLFLNAVIIVMDVSALTTASCAAFETVWKCHFIYLLMAQMMMQRLSAWTIKGEMASVDNWDKCEEKSRARMWTLGEPQRRICTRLLFSLMSNNLSPLLHPFLLPSLPVTFFLSLSFSLLHLIIFFTCSGLTRFYEIRTRHPGRSCFKHNSNECSHSSVWIMSSSFCFCFWWKDIYFTFCLDCVLQPFLLHYVSSSCLYCMSDDATKAELWR